MALDGRCNRHSVYVCPSTKPKQTRQFEQVCAESRGGETAWAVKAVGASFFVEVKRKSNLLRDAWGNTRASQVVCPVNAAHWLSVTAWKAVIG